MEPYWSYEGPVSEGGPSGWSLLFWVPIPMHLFSHFEHKQFRLSAEIDFNSSEAPRMTARASVADVSIENLHTERHLPGVHR